MKKALTTAFIILGFLGLYFYPTSSEDHGPLPPKGLEEAQILRSIDGDTIEVRLGGQVEKVRLIGVDCPESKHPETGVEAYALDASAFTRSYLKSRTLFLEKDQEERDHYGRILAYLWIAEEGNGDLVLFNRLLVEEGYALEVAYPPNLKYQKDLAQGEREAIGEKRGLWKEDKTFDPPIKANKKSGIYHLPTDPNYDRISPKNTLYFEKQSQAELEGYRRSFSK